MITLDTTFSPQYHFVTLNSLFRYEYVLTCIYAWADNQPALTAKIKTVLGEHYNYDSTVRTLMSLRPQFEFKFTEHILRALSLIHAVRLHRWRRGSGHVSQSRGKDCERSPNCFGGAWWMSKYSRQWEPENVKGLGCVQHGVRVSLILSRSHCPCIYHGPFQYRWIQFDVSTY